MSPTTAEAFAPAKVNLTLHVTGRRDDGYHLLDSLVIFADVGDRIAVKRASETHLKIVGLSSDLLPDSADNLVLRAAALAGVPPLDITLEKRLPVAAGLGGGSSDAAATLRAVAELTGGGVPSAGEALSLGADVPVCLAARPARMSGIGEVLRPVPPLPGFGLVLANPRVAVPTGAVFDGLARRDGAPMPDRLPRWQDAGELAAWLSTHRNDLEAPAQRIAPEIGEVLAALGSSDGCLLARMSGSGATCFGLFPDRAAADAAAGALSDARPGWWVKAACPWSLAAGDSG